MLDVCIIDDEPLARKRLSHLIEAMEGFEAIAEAENGERALQQVRALKPDIVLMDIRMPGMDGMEAAKHISQLAKPPAIIFTTAFSDHALQAFEAHAVDYVLKPVKRERLEKALQAAKRPTLAQLRALDSDEDSRGRSHICVKIRGTLELVPVKDIRYFLADQKYVTLGTAEHEYLIEEPLKSLEQEFSDSFTRIHRNALIADTYIVGMEKKSSGHHCIVLEGVAKHLEISRRHLALVRKKLKNLAIHR